MFTPPSQMLRRSLKLAWASPSAIWVSDDDTRIKSKSIEMLKRSSTVKRINTSEQQADTCDGLKSLRHVQFTLEIAQKNAISIKRKYFAPLICTGSERDSCGAVKK